jgi:hypothetical protein
MSQSKIRQAYKDYLFVKQKGICSICQQADLCFQCLRKEPHRICQPQKINHLDHNHTHLKCSGCESCARGLTHPYCNLVVGCLELLPSLQNDFVKEYVRRGEQPLDIKSK